MSGIYVGPNHALIINQSTDYWSGLTYLRWQTLFWYFIYCGYPCKIVGYLDGLAIILIILDSR